MARYSGKAGAVNVATGDVDGIKSWTLDQVYDVHESTAFDSSGVKAFLPGCYGWSGTFEGYKNGVPLTIGTEIALILEETQTAGQTFSGQAIISGLHASAGIDGLVAYSYDFQGTAALTIATA